MEFNFVKEFMIQQRSRPKLAAKTDKVEQIPLTFEQKRLYFLHHLNPFDTAYNMCIPLRIQGPINEEVIEKSVNEIIKRHDAFRITFCIKNEEPCQILHDELEIKINFNNVLNFHGETEKEAFEWITNETYRPFNLETGPLIRCSIAKCNDNLSFCLIIMHHIITDGWSTGILIKELSYIYTHFIQEQPIDLPSLPIQFSDYALYQDKLMSEQFIQNQLDYWKNTLPSKLNSVKLPNSYAHPKKESNGRVKKINIPEDVVKELHKLSNLDPNLSVFMILVATLRVLIYKYTHQKDIIIGAPLANRNSIEARNTIGYFANIILLYSKIDDDITFEDLLMSTMKSTLEAYLHQDMPFDYLVKELITDRDLDSNPIFQVAITYQQSNDNQVKFGDSVAQVVEIERRGSIFDITFMLYERNKTIDGWIEYNESYFTDLYIESLIQHYQSILKQMAGNSQLRISEIDLLTNREKNLMLQEWNSTDCAFSSEKNMHELFELQVPKSPNGIAVSYNEEKITYKDLNSRANKLARFLLAQGVEQNQIVAVKMHKSIDTIAVLLAILKVGAAYVPIESNYPVERIIYIVENSNANILILDDMDVELEYNSAQILTCPDQQTLNSMKYSDTNLELQLSSDRLAYIIYTSGTTGCPKGVMVYHYSAINLIEWVNNTFQVNSNDKLLFVTSICFDLSVYDIFGSLVAGAEIVIMNEADVRDPKKIISVLSNKNITFWDSAPAVLSQLVPYFNETLDLHKSKLRLVFLSGDWIPLKLADMMQTYFKNAQLVALGGATEATIWSNYYLVNEIRPDWISIPYGKPIQNSKYYILDNNKNICPINVEGDLYISGICLAKGYMNNPDLSKEKFIDNPFEEDPYHIMYCTGDRACYREDGNIEFLGRLDEQIKIRGFRIELAEIKNKLLEYRDVEDVIVTTTVVDEEKRIVAYIVPKESVRINPVDLRIYLRSKLPDYMIPSGFKLVKKIILSNNGKIDISAVQEIIESSISEDEYALNNELADKIEDIWSKVLNRTDININSNFFDLGGSSLLVSTVIYRIKDELDIDLEIKHIFIYQTLKELVNYIEYRNPYDEFLNLGEEAALTKEQMLEVDETVKQPSATVNNILLTGATGFIGRFLLRELLEETDAQIYCLVRADSVEAGNIKIKSNLLDNDLWKDSYKNRIVAVIGDLSKGTLGISLELYNSLCDIIDVIYHNGAIANYLAHYSNLKQPNVEGTKEIVKFASLKKIKPIHFSSTITVFNSGVDRVVNEFTSIEEEQHIKFPGYFASKWIGEKIISMAREKGIPCNIYRFGLITGDTEQGRYDKNQWFYVLIKSIYKLKATFDHMPDLNHAVMPVDVAIKQFVSVSKDVSLWNQNFYLCNPKRVPVYRLVERYNQFSDTNIETISLYQWIERAKQSEQNGIEIPFLMFIQHLANLSKLELEQWAADSNKLRLDIECSYSQSVYDKLSVNENFLTDSLIKKYFDFVLKDSNK